MKITLKTLQGKQLPMEVEADVTIENLKKQIEEQHAMPADSQQLVAYGKVLQEAEKTLGEYNIKDGDFLVVMIRKAKAAPKQPKAEEPKAQAPATTEATNPPATEQVAATNPPATTSQAAPVNPPAATNPPATTAPATSEQPAAQTEASLSPEDEEKIQNLMVFSGKPRQTCIQAMAAAFGDADRAFQYLDSGIPAQSSQPAGGMPAGMGGMPAGFDPAMMGNQELQEDSYEDEGSAAGGQGNVQALMDIANNPNFQQLRQRIIQNPQFYQEFMTMLQTQSPDVYAAIQQNPQLFMQLILGGGIPGAGGAGAGAGMPGMPAGMPGAGAGGAPNRPPGGGHVINVTQEELQSIERLEQLGFHRQRALQAFLACDKNEELAANFLFEQGADDDDDALNQGIAQSTGNVPAATETANVAQPSQPEAAANTEAAATNEEQPKPEGEQPAAENNSNEQPNNSNNNGDNNEGGAGAGGAEKSAFE